MKFIFLILFVTVFLFACSKNSNSFTAKGTIVKESIDGCTWLIRLDNTKILEPTNLSSFNVTIKDGQRVNLKYKLATDKFSICMMGKLVDVINISNN